MQPHNPQPQEGTDPTHRVAPTESGHHPTHHACHDAGQSADGVGADRPPEVGLLSRWSVRRGELPDPGAELPFSGGGLTTGSLFRYTLTLLPSG